MKYTTTINKSQAMYRRSYAYIRNTAIGFFLGLIVAIMVCSYTTNANAKHPLSSNALYYIADMGRFLSYENKCGKDQSTFLNISDKIFKETGHTFSKLKYSYEAKYFMLEGIKSGNKSKYSCKQRLKYFTLAYGR